MSDTPLERARKLAALATNAAAAPNEARSAAMACCKLIVEHGLLGQTNGEPRAASREPQWKKDFVDIGTRVASTSFHNFVQEMFRAAQHAEQMRRPPPGAPAPRKVDKKDRAARIEEDFRQMRFRTPENAISDAQLRRAIEAAVDAAMAREAEEAKRKPKHGGGGRVP